ncbi:NAD(P)/FAD-dependent oxidoreductase [Erythrobacter sp.]|jgi:predicted NAD/FAD-dependent oxidoreductase|uniref:NAD(P)/FAD-dependent oxidoreductase n=1 Tax=Erythrobacter sp. TaxID=1042 RepID=UPI002E9D5413|nr:FAD-dependent oxidoreductase [Erythrobacter sp.]
MSGDHSDVLIVGAGMAGLSCASALARSDLSVTLIDKGRGPGGRMATRRAEIAGDITSFDHGAQYFTARDPGFRAAVDQWEEQRVVARWEAAGEDAYVGIPGMNGPIRAMAEALDVRWKTRALTIEREGANWAVDTGKELFTAASVLVALPAEQAADLLEEVVPDLARTAGQATSAPCWAVMAGFATRLDIAGDIVRGSEDAPIAWAARNSAKPGRRGGEEAWVLHASPARSQAIIDLEPGEVATWLLDDFFEQTGAHCAAPIHVAAHRWLYAMPDAVEGEPARFDADARIGIAGDYLHSPRVEGAWLSGQALAEKVLAR